MCSTQKKKSHKSENPDLRDLFLFSFGVSGAWPQHNLKKKKDFTSPGCSDIAEFPYVSPTPLFSGKLPCKAFPLRHCWRGIRTPQ